jgi:hypothetical protein
MGRDPSGSQGRGPGLARALAGLLAFDDTAALRRTSSPARMPA